MSLDFERRPMLVFWETTRACPLRCLHCRAEAQPFALPGELDPAEGEALVRQVAEFGRPSPILVLTGGDCLARPEIHRLAALATELGVHVAMSPSVTPNLNLPSLQQMRDAGAKAISISLDGASAATHEGVRGVQGHFEDTVSAIQAAVGMGFRVQINTTVMRQNLEELPDVASLIHALGVHIWEVFFLVVTGRAGESSDIRPEESEEVCHLLFDSSGYGFTVRTVEAPFFRRIAAWRRRDPRLAPAQVAQAFGLGPYYQRAAGRLRELLGPPTHRPASHTVSTRDGSGIVFVAHDGEVYPAGFLPVALGNVRRSSLASIYQRSATLKAIRSSAFNGRCGYCEYRELCGGSRSRAYAASGDVLGEDPACPYRPLAS